MMKSRFLPFSQIARSLLGGVPSNQNRLARFAVSKKENALVEFERVVKATLHHLWVKPWLNFKDLHPITSSDLGCKKDEDGSGWREVPGDDPEVQHVAEHAFKTIQHRCNCSVPYVLEEVVHANAEITGETVKFNMLLKGKRGEKNDKYKVEEKYKVEVHKNHEGTLHLYYLEPHHD